MTLPPLPAPSAPAPGSPRLGRVALWLGVATVACAILMTVFSLVISPRGILAGIPMLGVPLGVAAVVVGVIAIIQRRGRRQGIIGLVLAIAAGPAAWLLAAVYVFVSLALFYRP